MQPETKTRKNPKADKSIFVDIWTLRKHIILRQLLWLRRRTINQMRNLYVYKLLPLL